MKAIELTKQQEAVLKYLKKDPLEIKKSDVGNIYEVLSRLTQKGLIKRMRRGVYSITTLGKDYLNNRESKIKSFMLTSQEIKEFEEASKEVMKLSNSFAPNLLGLEKEKVALLLAMISSEDIEGDRHRIHVLFTGDPGCGKSSLIKEAYRNLWGFYADSDAKSAALKGTGNGYQTTEGLLSKAHNSTLFLDELDKMDRENQSSLLASMEQGFHTINKDKVVGKHVESSIRCVSTCNNIELIRDELRDRFDLVFNIKNLTPDEKSNLLRVKINDWGREKSILRSPEFLKKYLQYAKSIKTTLPEDREELVQFLTQELDSGSLQGKDVRGLETAIRLCIAIAKLQLKKEADIEDCKTAIMLLREE